MSPPDRILDQFPPLFYSRRTGALPHPHPRWIRRCRPNPGEYGAHPPVTSLQLHTETLVDCSSQAICSIPTEFPLSPSSRTKRVCLGIRCSQTQKVCDCRSRHTIDPLVTCFGYFRVVNLTTRPESDVLSQQSCNCMTLGFQVKFTQDISRLASLTLRRSIDVCCDAAHDGPQRTMQRPLVCTGTQNDLDLQATQRWNIHCRDQGCTRASCNVDLTGGKWGEVQICSCTGEAVVRATICSGRKEGSPATLHTDTPFPSTAIPMSISSGSRAGRGVNPGKGTGIESGVDAGKN